MEDLEDLIAAQAAEADERFPHDFVVRLLSGEENPVRVWRDYRGLSQKHLAEMAGMQQGYLSEIETGRKPGSLGAYRALAEALGCLVDDLLPRA